MSDIKKYSIVLLSIVLLFIFARIALGLKDNTNYVKLGNKYFLERNYDEAIKNYEKAIEIGYKTLDVYYNLAWIYYYEKKDLKKAEWVLKKGVIFYPIEGVLHNILSQLYFDRNNFNDAVNEYKLAVESDKDRIILINMRRAKELLRQQKKSDKEINDFFESIILFNPKDYFALYEIAKYSMKNKKYKEAIEQFKKVLDLNSEQTYIYADIATCYYELGETELGDKWRGSK